MNNLRSATVTTPLAVIIWGRGSSHGAAEAVQIKPYQTYPNITKLQNQQVHVKMGWYGMNPPPKYDSSTKGTIALWYYDVMAWWVCTSGWCTTIVASGRKLPVPIFQASIWLLRCFLLFWTALSTKTPGKSWSEKVKRNGKKTRTMLVEGYYYHKISVVQIMVLRTSSLYHPWYGNSPCQWH